jgi:hypothetical protein
MYNINMPTNPFLALATASTKVPGEALWAIFAFFALVYIIISSILAYHWKEYGLGSKKIAFAAKLYFTISLLMLIGGILSILSF